jgi:hypothetical protein
MRSGQYRLSKRGFLYYILDWWSPSSTLRVFCSRVLARRRDVVYLGWPIAPSHLSPIAGGCGVSANEYICAHGAQINFGDLTPYLTYCMTLADWWRRQKETYGPVTHTKRQATQHGCLSSLSPHSPQFQQGPSLSNLSAMGHGKFIPASLKWG